MSVLSPIQQCQSKQASLSKHWCQPSKITQQTSPLSSSADWFLREGTSYLAWWLSDGGATIQKLQIAASSPSSFHNVDWTWKSSSCCWTRAKTLLARCSNASLASDSLSQFFWTCSKWSNNCTFFTWASKRACITHVRPLHTQQFLHPTPAHQDQLDSLFALKNLQACPP